MKTEVCCKYNGIFWQCQKNIWDDQDENCRLAIRSKTRSICIYFCNGDRCDNPYAHKKAQKNGANCTEEKSWKKQSN
jgi:hypothetical protein